MGDTAPCKALLSRPMAADREGAEGMLRDEVRAAWEGRWGSLDGRFLHRFLHHEMMTDLEELPDRVLQQSIGVHRKLRAVSLHARRLMSGEELAEGCDCERVLTEDVQPDRGAHKLVIAEGPVNRGPGGRPNTESVHGMCTCGWERYGSRASVFIAYTEHLEDHDPT